MKTKIIIADDHPMVSGPLSGMLEQTGEYDILKVVVNGKELLEELHFNTPDIVILDYNMPVLNGFDTAKILLREYPQIKVIILTMHNTVNMIKPLLKLGIKAIVLKNNAPEELIKAVKSISDKKTYFSQEVIRFITNDIASNVRFTTREIEVIKLIKEGLSSKLIADKLSIAINTVESHRKNIFAKTGCNSSITLLRYIEEQGIL